MKKLGCQIYELGYIKLLKLFDTSFFLQHIDYYINIINIIIINTIREQLNLALQL